MGDAFWPFPQRKGRKGSACGHHTQQAEALAGLGSQQLPRSPEKCGEGKGPGGRSPDPYLGSCCPVLPLPYSGITLSRLIPALQTGHTCRLGLVSSHCKSGGGGTQRRQGLLGQQDTGKMSGLSRARQQVLCKC